MTNHRKLTRHHSVTELELPLLFRSKGSPKIQKFGFINGGDNVNWPQYRDSKS